MDSIGSCFLAKYSQNCCVLKTIWAPVLSIFIPEPSLDQEFTMSSLRTTPFWLAMLTLSLSTSALLEPRQAASPLYLFNFGDSYTQNGFVFDITGPLPTSSDPTGHPAIGTDTVAGGPAYPEWLTVTYNKTLVFDYDFGYGGATVNRSLIAPGGNINSGIATFEEQVDSYFAPMFSSGDNGLVPWTGATSIFTAFFGINDILVSCPTNPPQSLEDEVLESYFNSATALYDYGARNFLFINVPPFDRSPSGCGSCNTTYCNDIIESANSGLATDLGTWAQGLPGVNAQLYDLHSFMSGVLDNPTAYGFTDATCADDGSLPCVWWNVSTLHPGYAFHQIWAQDMVGVLSELGF